MAMRLERCAPHTVRPAYVAVLLPNKKTVPNVGRLLTLRHDEENTVSVLLSRDRTSLDTSSRRRKHGVSVIKSRSLFV
jgi:hypothetical protein